jgi:glycosyltransferase involved in cell wall biosynthesis
VISVVNCLNRGGIETQLLQALPALCEAGVEMDICSTGPGVLDGQYAAYGCRLWQIPKSPNCLTTARHFQRVLAQRSYDCVHCNLEHASGGYALGAAKAGVPIAVSFHLSMPGSLAAWRNKPGLAQIRKLWLLWHRRLMDRHVRIFVGHSEANIRAVTPDWKEQPKRYRTVMNGVSFPASLPGRNEARRALGLDDKALVLLNVGNFKLAKNHMGLLRIFQETLRRRPEATLLLVGGGPLRGAVEEQSQKMGLGRRVRFEGASANVWPYYAAADVFVFPSEVEGFGNVLVESQGVGTPIVASAIPPHCESVAPVQHRFLFPLPDYAKAAELVLQQAAAAAARTNDWVAAARDYVRQRFGIERFAADLRKLYLDLQAG